MRSDGYRQLPAITCKPMPKAKRPHRQLAFAGAIALVGCLAGRRICDEMNCRTNIYVMGLANSASGKDFPRSVSMQILTAAGLHHYIGGKIGSGEGLLDSLNRSLNRLHHTDELSVMLSEIASGKNPAKESIMGALLSLYSDSSNVSVQRTLAKQEKTVVYDQPCVCLFGTAVPKLYYGAMNEKMLSNGFLSRLFIVDGGNRAPTNYRKREPIPERIVEYAKWWANFNPITDQKSPFTVTYSADAVTAIRELDALADSECSRAGFADDNVKLSVWGRVSEQTRKLALICAASRYYDFLGDITSLRISKTDIDLCSKIVLHTTKRMLWFANRYSASSPTMTLCTRILDKLRIVKKPMPRSMLLRTLHVSSKELTPAIDTLLERGDLEIDYSNVGMRGVTGIVYILNRK
ncbi:MAG: DUF3987 domain-containing protein [Thermoguttaceae bacterium]|nr:DUF3987 domain-containing protein [Thermoguttaceae bacterium]